MKLFSYLAAVVLLAGITVSAAIVQGRLSKRWDAGSEYEPMVELLAQIPKEFGEWKLMEEQQLPKAAVNILQCSAYSNRVYAHQRTGDQISVTLLLGPSGPMTVHTPEVCLDSRAFESMAKPDRILIRTEDGPSPFYHSMFKSTDPTKPALEILYGWNKLEGWEAPDAPRFAFGGTPMIFKLQVVSQLWPNVGSGETGLAANFLTEWLRAMPQGLDGRKQQNHDSE